MTKRRKPPTISASKRPLKLNPGAQEAFVTTSARHAAYIGGIGAGKTFAMVVRGMRYMDLNKVSVPGWEPCKGAFLSISALALKDNVYPAMRKVIRYNPQLGWSEEGTKSDMIWWNKRGQEILMRSLDDPDRIRGIELAWFGQDEGRNFETDYGYRVMIGRLRQGMDPDLYDPVLDDFPDVPWEPGHSYLKGGWVTSTPNGYDWQYTRFHASSDEKSRFPGAEWYKAATTANKRNLDPDYLRDLMVAYEGRFYRQELEGEIVGSISGAVFDNFDQKKHVGTYDFDPTLPLYSFWDFGIGEIGVCLFAQLDYVPKVLGDYSIELVPSIRVIGSIEMKDKTPNDWANAWKTWLLRHTTCEDFPRGKLPDQSWGDPAGGQRHTSSSTGTSTLQALAAAGVPIIAAPRKPKDEAVLILANMLEGDGRFGVDERLKRVWQAMEQYHWKVDEGGNRIGNAPIHDWSSHYCDALQYGALGILSLFNLRREYDPMGTQRGTWGFIEEQLLGNSNNDETVMGMDIDKRRPMVDWHPDRKEDWNADW